MAGLSVVGKSIPRVDALSKVMGTARYAIDESLNVPRMLHGRILYSHLAHAKVLHIDTTKAEKVAGVVKIVTGRDVPDLRMGYCIHDQHLLVRDKVRFIGDAVAAVASKTVEAAEEALDLIRVEYEELPAVFDAEEAMRPDCPVVIHPELAKYNRPIYAHLGWDLPAPNVHTHHKIRCGNVKQAFQMADIIVENRFTTERIAHAQLELPNAFAYIDDDGVLNVWSTSKQIFAETHKEICRVFGLSLGKVRVRARYLGGNFGTIARTELFAALLALKTEEPVQILFSREESFTRDLHRMPVTIHIKDGVKRNGTIIAREMMLVGNGGAYSEQTPLLTRNGSFQASMYKIPNFKWDAYAVYTNTPSCGALRGFGNSQPLWAVEQQMDIIAEKLKMDPVELREKNLIAEGEEDIRGELTHSIGAQQCLSEAARWIGWDKSNKTSSGLKRGRGLALGNKYTMVDTVSAASVKICKDGTVEVRHGADELGQGLNTVLAQITAEEFGIPIERVKVIWGDTVNVPYDTGSISSRSTLYAGNAVQLACRDAKRQLFEIAAPQLEIAAEELKVGDGRVYSRSSPEKTLAISDLFLPDAKGAQNQALCLSEGGEIIGKATFLFKDIGEEDPLTGQVERGKKLTASYCYIAQAAEVAVNVETGVVKVLRFCSAADTGRSINPKLCEGQLEGGATMGIGSALFEGLVIDQGKVLTANFTDYRVPKTMEIPSGDNIKSVLIDAPHRDGPFGAKGVGEASMTPSAPAIANAIYNATGVRIMDLPMTPEKVFKALKDDRKYQHR